MYLYQDQLESKRLITRFLTKRDISVWAAFFEESEAIEFLPDFGFNSNVEKARHLIEKQLDRYRDKRFGLQAVLDKETKHLLGLCGLLQQEVDGKAEIEVGYHFLKKNWGKGYAPEAARLFIQFAFENKLTDSVISIIDVHNTNSQRVAEKNGLQIEKQSKWIDGEDVFIYRINKLS